MSPPRIFDPPPPDYRPALARLDRETTARLTDHGTAHNFTLRATPPPTFEQSALFTSGPEPDHGPAPIDGQLDLAAYMDEAPAPEKPNPRPHTPPDRGQLCKIIGSGLGLCRYYREHIGTSGAISWLVIDEKCNQYHAARPSNVRIVRKPRHA